MSLLTSLHVWLANDDEWVPVPVASSSVIFSIRSTATFQVWCAHPPTKVAESMVKIRKQRAVFFSHCVRNKALTLDIVLTSGKNQFIPKTYEWIRISHRDNRRCRMKKENLNQHKHAKNTQDLSDELRELNILCFTLSQLHPSRESPSSSHHLCAALFVASAL